MAKCSAEDIGIMLELPAEIISGLISRLTGGLPSGYELKLIRKHNRKLKVAVSKANKSRLGGLPMRTSRTVKTVEERYKTLRRDMSQLQPIRINSKTVVYVRKDADIDEIKRKYEARDPQFLKPVNPNIAVANFKPGPQIISGGAKSNK